MTQPKLESPCDFRDPEKAAAWAAGIADEAEWRELYFEAFTGLLNARFETPFTAIELGSGPGHLAAAILEGTRVETYIAVDYSAAMHDLASAHLGDQVADIRFEVRDFREPDWSAGLGPVDAVVTLMAAHEVRRKDRLLALFTQVARALVPGGLFLFADFYAAGPEDELYLTQEGQRAALLAAGFETADMVLEEAGLALWVAERG